MSGTGTVMIPNTSAVKSNLDDIQALPGHLLGHHHVVGHQRLDKDDETINAIPVISFNVD